MVVSLLSRRQNDAHHIAAGRAFVCDKPRLFRSGAILVISRIEAWHRGHAVPRRLFETSDKNSPNRKAHSFRFNSPLIERFPFAAGNFRA